MLLPRPGKLASCPPVALCFFPYSGVSPPHTLCLMAALRRIAGQNPRLSHLSLLPPALSICCRAIATKLFVGGNEQHRVQAMRLKAQLYSKKSFVPSPVAGLSYYTTENGLSEAFSQYGQVIEAKIVMDRVSDRSKGFGFVTFASEDEAKSAVTEMNGKALNGRVVFVEYAKPKATFDHGMPIARGPPEPISDN